ncbi:MAG TPA: hypothetical protein VL306_02575 [Methylomirabilota bacterium]|nr:hypothetical protein [Methylomirabilota bacterium]
MFSLWKQKENNKIFTGFLVILIAGVFLLGLNRQFVLGDTTSDDLQAQKDAKQQELNAIKSKINGYQSQIKEISGQANTLANQIKILNLQLVETQAQIDATENEIDAANLEIADVTNKIVQTQKDIAKQKEVLATLVADINDLDQRSPLEIALENDNFQEFLDQVQYNSSVQEQSQASLTKIKQLTLDLDIRNADLIRCLMARPIIP